MAEQILFNFAEKLLVKLGSLAFQQLALAWGVEKELRKLERKISPVKNVLLDAEEQQETNRAVRDWLQQVKGIVYDVDDLVDEFATEALRREVEIHGSRRKEVRNFFSRSNPFKFRYAMGHKIKGVSERFDELIVNMKRFEFAVKAVEIQVQARGREETYSFVRNSEVFGRESDNESIIAMLMCSADEVVIPVIPIVGMGGLGKTTLAQLVYNDDRVANQFDQKIWVCVSKVLDVKKIVIGILKAIGDNSCENLAFEQLQTRLQQNLRKNFLLVLDDVWSEDRVKWIELLDFLMVGAGGSRIIITTRSKAVASMIGTHPLYYLKGLSDDDCLSVFMKWAFNKGGERNHQKLVTIGREIVKKCKGVPLAARTLGGLLYLKTDERDWLRVRDNEMWAIVQTENDIMPILKLSYDQMPSYLKQCFGYCSLLRKDERIEKWRLIYFWMAQGFIHSSEEDVELEDIGERYVDELVMKSFLEVEAEGYYKMHDLVHDLAQFVAGDECLTMRSNANSVPERLRHVSFHLFWDIPHPRLLEAKRLRTLLAFNDANNLSFRVLGPALISIYRFLRVLEINDFVVHVPSSIGELKHLRTLSVQSAYGLTLPDSIGSLLNLQHLHLRIRSFPEVPMFELPPSLGKLVNLRHLSLCSTFLISLPPEVSGLTSLRRLNISIALHLRSLSNGILHLSCLRYLQIFGCPLLPSLPVGMRFLTKLEELIIHTCEILELKDDDLKGLTSLRSLTLWELPMLVSIPVGLQESAATLQDIQIVACSELTTLSNSLEYLTELRTLEIFYCPNLLSLPNGMEYLTNLETLKIKGCTELSRRCDPTGEDWYKIDYVPNIDTDFQRSLFFMKF